MGAGMDCTLHPPSPGHSCGQAKLERTFDVQPWPYTLCHISPGDWAGKVRIDSCLFGFRLGKQSVTVENVVSRGRHIAGAFLESK
jgi:hypothetical protein